MPNLAFSFETSLKGFIALDAINYEKIQRKEGAAIIGIGVLDLKIFAEQDDMTAAIKLNIDGNLSIQNSIFEEAYASYRGIKNWKFTLGKGVVKFQNLHWGAVENTYLDGGSVLGTENSWRKVSNKALLSAAFGHRSLGFLDTVTIWGDSVEVVMDDAGIKPQYVTTGDATNKIITSYKTQNVPAFTTSKQIGVAHKFELYPMDDWTLTTGQIFYQNRLAPKKSYAFDFGLNKEGSESNYWVDMLYGFSSKAPYDLYTTYAKSEYFLQLGAQYYLNEIWSLIENTEFLYTSDQAHTYNSFTIDGVNYTTDSKIDKNGQTVKTISYKFESAVQYKLSKSSFVTTGILYEKKNASRNGVHKLTAIKGLENANAEAFKLASSVSFWF
jgi:hypothetical protein